MTDQSIDNSGGWEEYFNQRTTIQEVADLPTLSDFLSNLASPEWDQIKDTVDKAAKAFAFDGFSPQTTAKLISKKATGGVKQIAALVVLALEVGSLTTGPKVIAKGAAEDLINAFGIQKSAQGNSMVITFPRVVLAFPGYAFQILRHRKVSPKVTIPHWPKELSFPGSINVLHSEARELLLDAYNMWSVVFGLTISQGTKNNRNKKVVAELNSVLSGEPVSDLTWSETMQFTKIASKEVLLKGSQQYPFTQQLAGYAEDLAKCILAAKMRCIVHPSIDLSSEDVEKTRVKIFAVLSKAFPQSS